MLRLVAVLAYLALESAVKIGFDAGAAAFGFIAEGIKRIRQRRRAKRAAKELGTPKEGSMGKLADVVGKYRTSTKGGVVGLLAPLVVAVPFYDEINSFVVQACQSEDGPLVFLAGAGITWVSFFVTTRLSRTPANPGKL